MIRNFLWIFFCFFFDLTQAQEVVLTQQEALEKLKPTLEFYQQSDVFFLKTVVSSFDDIKTVIPFETTKGFYYRDGLCLHSFSMGVELIQNDQLLLVVDSANRQILLSAPERQNIISEQQLEYSVMESDSILFEHDKNKEKARYYFGFPQGGQLLGVELSINKNGSIGKYIMYYNLTIENEQGMIEKKEPRVEIIYDFISKPLKHEAICDLSKYLVKEGEQWKATKLYQNYTVVDSRVEK